MVKRILQISSFIFIVLIILLVGQNAWLLELKQGNLNIIQAFRDNEVQLFLFVFALMIAHNLFPLFPVPAIIALTTITAFDAKLMFIWVWSASIIGATLSFLLARFWLHRWTMDKLPLEFKQKVSRRGFQFVLILRVLPFVSMSLINYGAGMSSVRFFPYVFATAIGNFIYFAVLHLISTQWIEVETDTGVMILVALIIGGLFLAYKFAKPWIGKMNRKNKEDLT